MSEVATNADTGPPKDDGAPIKSGLSIQQILEGMTNEFNKTGPKKQNESVKRLSKTEPPMQKQEKPPIKVVEDNSKTTNVQDCTHNVEDDIKIIRENIPDKASDNMKKPDDSAPKQESINKKDRARIVLTFRTIDENTDHGKKTKISSLPSNLSLVPDEFANCDEIGGVSVKIEDFDESCKDANKSDTEESQTVDNPNSSTTGNIEVREENALGNCKETTQQQKESHQETVVVTPESNHASHNNSDISTDKSFEESESTLPNTRKTRRKRLKEYSDEGGLKRSARHLSKELKSTVLESAMARKEKFNYTEENSRRRYSKPGRPKKLTPEKKDNTKDIPKLTPIDPTKFMTDKKSLPELCPLNSIKNIMPTNSINLTDSQKRNKYEGMPKLTPIIKSCEIVKAKSTESVDAINSMNNALKNLDEIFLKPIPTKSKPEKVRPPSPTKKIMKGNNSKESSSVSNGSEPSQEDVSLEGCSPNKRIRRNMIPSPSTAEGIASKPESTAILTKKHNKLVNRRQDMQCLCEVRSQLFVTITSAESPLYCTALDSNDNRIVGCCNLVDHDDVAMRRPSARIPYIILCRMHKERLIRHNCCPTCGLFCSQGKFVHCSNGHQYHRDCEMYYDNKPLCPHCGSYGRSYDVIITMSGKRKPIHIPPQKQVPKEPQAKISLPGIGDNEKLAEQQTVLKKSTEPLIDPDLVKIPKPISLEKMERYTISSLLSAVKNDDVQKLVNVLANGFNANHSFRDQSQRTSLHIAANKGSLICVHILVQAGAQHNALDKNQLSPLMLAAGNGHVEVIRYLMRVGADATFKGEDGMTALHIAAKSGHLEACRTILSECEDRRTLVDSVDDGGWTSLIWACEFRHADIAKFLLDNRCDPLIRDSEQNIALHWSAFSGSSEITEMLLSLGCDVNAANVHGDTPLHIASRQDQYAVSVLLLSRGAKIREKNIMGDTPLECCLVPGDTKNALELNLTVNPSNLLEKTVRILTNDISRGKETNPIQCVNGLDLEDKPTDFVYVTENCYTSKINVDRTITSLQSCRCENQCNTDKCICGKISLRCWYDDEKYEGKLVPEFNYADPPMLFECNAACDCNKITCNNRVVQHGITQRFQLFRTSGKGWGLRTLRLIPKGAYVCEYVGEVISDSEADLREDDSYLFDLDNRDGETYCIDARRYGNIARFINHSCAPNLLPVRVFIDHQDLHFPRIAFFANRDIDADEELGFDYGEKFWIVKCKSFTCTCGAENCRYSDKTIQITLDNYRKRIQQEEVLASQVSTTQKL